MKTLLKLWHTAKTVRNPALRLLAMAVAGFLIVEWFIPAALIRTFLKNGLASRKDIDPEFIPNNPLMSPLDPDWGNPSKGSWM